MVIAPTSGDVQIEVRPLESLAGGYELKVETAREATPDDVKPVEMQAKFLEGNRVSLQRTPEAQQSAIHAGEEAAALARSVGERDMFALSVNTLKAIDVGAALESLGLPSLSGKVPVYYSPAYERRATELRDRIVRAVDFFELALRASRQPSVIQFRGEGSRKPDALARTLLANLSQLKTTRSGGSNTRIGAHRHWLPSTARS